jgi:head-tail adaptor
VSLLDAGREEVTVFPQVSTVDPSGNTVFKPAVTGVVVLASVQPISSTEPSVAGQETVATYRVRVNRRQAVPLGPWSKVLWDGRSWDLDGEPARYTGSAATEHVSFRIKSRVSGVV